MSCAGSTWRNGASEDAGWRRLGVSGTGPCRRRAKPRLKLSLWSPATISPDTASEGRVTAPHSCPITHPPHGELLSVIWQLPTCLSYMWTKMCITNLPTASIFKGEITVRRSHSSVRPLVLWSGFNAYLFKREDSQTDTHTVWFVT